MHESEESVGEIKRVLNGTAVHLHGDRMEAVSHNIYRATPSWG